MQLFGIAGGIGMGVFSFYYQKEDVATFFLAGRHKWHDDAAYLNDALDLFGIQPIIQETGRANAAEQQLRDRIMALYDGEVAAHAALLDSISS
jgi:hypothetical protein